MFVTVFLGTAWFLKVNNAPKYLYQVDLLHKVDEMQTEVQMFPDHILIILGKVPMYITLSNVASR